LQRDSWKPRSSLSVTQWMPRNRVLDFATSGEQFNGERSVMVSG